MLEELRVTTIQTNLVWENINRNQDNFKTKIGLVKGLTDIIVLPEMFTTGFSMNPKAFAQSVDGQSVDWMKKMAAHAQAIIIGSLIIEEDGKYFNRLLVVFPEGNIKYYNKRHLFAMAGENISYTAGDAKLIFEFKGWRICPFICYDLRFPVWSRNVSNYDVLIYVANWPEKRNTHWKALLKARAIENQAYVVGVNRIGEDGNKLAYSGDTCVYDALGQRISTTEPYRESIETVILSSTELEHVRKSLPFAADADQFTLL